MRRMALPIGALGLLLAGSALRLPAEGNRTWDWSTSLGTTVAIGDTRYLMERSGYLYSSELIFPLDTLLAGVSFRGERAAGRREGRRDWSFEASVAANLLAPLAKMTDSDWLMSAVYPKAAFSYTESDMTMFWLVAAAAWRPVLSSGSWGSWEAVLGYRLQYVRQEANGYTGWFYADEDGNPGYELYGDSYSGRSLAYWVLWNVATAGVSASLTPARGVSVRAEAGAAVPYAADEDDHVLRNFASTASGLGIGAYAQLALEYSWGKPEARVRPVFRLSVDFLALKANTSQTVTYYGDDPATEDEVEQPGDHISGVDHQLSTRQFSVALTCGAAY